jgi:predicted AlkP superfamily pyrophosphatase or phosphodiesterase
MILMTIRFPRTLLWAVCLALTTTAVLAAPKPPRVKHVFIISYDQGNPSLMQRTELPTFHQMAAAGARTWEAYTIVPSITLPSHVSMLTGVGIQKHQISWNDHRPDRGHVQVPTVFSLAKERGLKTAMFVGKEKLQTLEIPGTIDVLVWPQPTDDAKSIARAFAAEFGKSKPNLTFLHFRDPDTVGHATGAYSPEKIQSLKDCDEALTTIKNAVAAAGVLNDSVFILTADHGAHDTKNREGKTVGSHGDSRPEDVLIPWVAWGKGVRKNFDITAPVLQYDTAATALWLLKVPLPEHFWGRPVTSAFK